MENARTRQTQRLFYLVFFASLIFSAGYLALRRGAGLMDFFYQQGTNLLGDFTNNLHYPTHEGGPYFDSIWATFPPFAYTIFYLVNVCFTRAIPNAETVAYLLLTGITAMMMLYAMQRIFERYGHSSRPYRSALAFGLCVLLSGVSLYTLERGNSAYHSMVILLFFLFLRDDESAWKREAALILLAVAAGVKIYPCVFGVLYLLEKRYREALRLVIYGVLLFFVPFLWFGGLDGLNQFLYNQEQIHLLQRNDFLTSIPSVARFLAAELGWNVETASAVGQWIGIAFGAVALVCACLTRSLWRRCALLVGIVTLVPGWSAEYMALYFALPCALFFCGGDDRPAPLRYAYSALFAGVFILLPFGTDFALHAPVSWNMLVCFSSIYALVLLTVADVLHSRFSKRRAAAAAG
ncbi:MAG TPA: glycosyltransferase family 87 protein [Candidatus Limiplasma sp.]|nr:glycosyltransferase family 87 protein [Candidatus Limiplasma sp.]